MVGKAFFFQRLNDHVQYLRKIQATLDGKGDFRGMSCHDCKLGRWLDGDGPAEASAVSAEAREIFDRLIEPHEQFHQASARALELQEAGDSEGARKAITEMDQLSVKLIDTLLELDKLSN